MKTEKRNEMIPSRPNGGAAHDVFAIVDDEMISVRDVLEQAMLMLTDEQVQELLGNLELMLSEALASDNEEHDQFNSDAEADADALASAGWGTDEDYGGGDERY